MIKIVYRILIKEGKQKEFRDLATKVLIPQAISIEGYLLFSLYENQNNPREFIFYEIWKNNGAVEKYYKNLIQALGKNSPGKIFPDKLNDFIEEEEDILHQDLGSVED